MNCLQKLAAAACCAIAVCLGLGSATAETKPEGETRFAVCVTIPPACLDPGQTSPVFLVTVKGGGGFRMAVFGD
jgi:hypothetical protein